MSYVKESKEKDLLRSLKIIAEDGQYILAKLSKGYGIFKQDEFPPEIHMEFNCEDPHGFEICNRKATAIIWFHALNEWIPICHICMFELR